MVATTVVAVLLGISLCAAIVAAVTRRLGLPVRETLMWLGLIELDIPAVARRAGRSGRR